MIERKRAFFHVDELLNHEGHGFLLNTYQCLLNRDPDPDGLKYYLGRLREGKDKLDVLAQISKSEEAKKNRVSVIGLRRAIYTHRALNLLNSVPLIGSHIVKFFNSNKKKPSVKKVYAYVGNDLSSIKEFLGEMNLPSLTLETFKDLNPDIDVQSSEQFAELLMQQSVIRKIRVDESNEKCAKYFNTIGIKYEERGGYVEAQQCYLISLMFMQTGLAHEHMGNINMQNNSFHSARLHYEQSIELGSSGEFLFANLGKVYLHQGKKTKALQTFTRGLRINPSSDLLLREVDKGIDAYWKKEGAEIDFLAECQNRKALISKYEEVTEFIAQTYLSVYERCSKSKIKSSLNYDKVLIIGLDFNSAPQCYRYRIEQKMEQLQFAGYQTETVAWHEQKKVLDTINFYDLIIFYRVPAFPGVLKQVAYAKALGKITFFEVDDLLFEEDGLPAYETYGGQISLEAYKNLTKDIGTYRGVARQCDFAIASTLPLLNRLKPLVKTKIGYLHRNGLDKYNNQEYIDPSHQQDEFISIFYGSGTLAHNTDFIIEALPALSKLLREYKNVKLVIMGFLSLPSDFQQEFRNQLVQIPFVKDVSAYYSYLSSATINIAVLHDDSLTACKSELKWFEAATYSIPSVVSRTQNYLDVIDDGKNGFIVSGESEWYSVLKKLIESKELRVSVGQEAQRKVFDAYSVKALAKNIDEIINDAKKYHYSQLLK